MQLNRDRALVQALLYDWLQREASEDAIAAGAGLAAIGELPLAVAAYVSTTGWPQLLDRLPEILEEAPPTARGSWFMERYFKFSSASERANADHLVTRMEVEGMMTKPQE